MKKKYAIVNVKGYLKEEIHIMSKEEFGLCLCPCEVITESDSFKEICELYNKEYKHD